MTVTEKGRKTMREVIFRGKQKDNGEWVYGDLIHYACNNGDVGIDNGFLVEDENDIETFDVIPETVGQYTGLTDKNGTKIFEGDIVRRDYTLRRGETKRTRETQIGVVSYSNKECGFCLDKVCNLRKPWDGDTIEVIGNIHDNPDLMKNEEAQK